MVDPESLGVSIGVRPWRQSSPIVGPHRHELSAGEVYRVREMTVFGIPGHLYLELRRVVPHVPSISVRSFDCLLLSHGASTFVNVYGMAMMDSPCIGVI
jgi:hypothetical protein